MSMSKNVKVGIFLIVGAVLFTAGLFLIGNHNQVFQGHFDVYTDFDNVDTLQSGAMLRVSGMDAGSVSDIAIPRQPGAKFRLTLHVDKKFQDIIRKDSVASISTEGMVGNKYVNIAEGSANSPRCAQCTLPSKEPVELGALMQQGGEILQSVKSTITDLRQRADTTISHVDGTIVAMRGNVEQIASNGAQISGKVNGMVTDVQAGRGTVGKLLTDQQMANNVGVTIANAKQTSANIQQASQKADQMVTDFQKQDIPEDIHATVANAKDMSAQLKKSLGDFLSSGTPGQSTGEALRETVVEAHRATTNLASDTEAIKHNFFLRGFFRRRGYYNLTQFNPTTYAKSKFVKQPSKRVWLAADGIFTKAASGAEKISDEGRAALDETFSRLTDDLPNNPIMIEGYADQGSPAQQYRAAEERATAVKKYLVQRFQLRPDLIGAIPLRDKPPPGTGKNTWNGICFAMVVSRK